MPNEDTNTDEPTHRFQWSISARIAAMAAGILGVCAVAIISIVLGISSSTQETERQVALIGEQSSLLAGQANSVEEQFIAIQEQVDALARQDHVLEAVESFVDMRYWLVDLSLSWLNESEDSANIARENLESRLAAMEQDGVVLSPELPGKVAKVNELMLESVDAYIDENRVLGNSLVVEARRLSEEIATELNDILAISRSDAQVAGQTVVTHAEEVNTATVGVQGAAQQVKEAGETVLGRNEFTFNMSLIALLAATAISAVLAWRIRKSIVTPLLSAVEAIEGFGTGDMTQKLDDSREDEIGRMAKAFNAATDGIQKALETDQVDWVQLAEDQAAMTRLMAIVEQAPVNLIQADLDLNIAFQNQSSSNSLAELQDTLGICPDTLLGRPIDVFLDRESNIRNTLQTSAGLPIVTEVSIGEEVLELQFSAIYEADGTYSGPSMAWKILTEERKMDEHLQTTTLTLIACADEMRASSNELLKASNDTSRIAEETLEQTNDVSEGAAAVSAATSQMTGTVSTIAQSSSDLAQSADQAVEAAQSASSLVETLRDANKQISRMSATISEIADQTNLLALNATIEAAGAGEAGRGFSVVAAEVKELARGTMQATSTINQHVQDINCRSENVAAAIEDITNVIQSVNDLALELSDAVGQQGAATDEISAATSLNVERSRAISDRMSEVSQAAEVSTHTAQGVTEAAEQLRSPAQNLKQQD
jgi:methyl-accepting chemotaxis protein